ILSVNPVSNTGSSSIEVKVRSNSVYYNVLMEKICYCEVVQQHASVSQLEERHFI
ncbi:MAG: hypothetical protein EZS28_030376, partial [Streblomastix strix]